MASLNIQPTEDTPQIIFDTTENQFEISGKSLPENAIEFYEPIHKWIDNYIKSPLDRTVIEFKLDYFNTASAKQIAKLMKLLESIKAPNKVMINWYYQKIDTDMYNSGVRYSKLINIEFKIIEY